MLFTAFHRRFGFILDPGLENVSEEVAVHVVGEPKDSHEAQQCPAKQGYVLVRRCYWKFRYLSHLTIKITTQVETAHKLLAIKIFTFLNSFTTGAF